MFWHIDTDIISLLVILSIYISNRRTPASNANTLRNRRFQLCLCVGIAITVIDIAASIVMETSVPVLIYHFMMTLYFTSLQLVIIAWFFYVLAIIYENDERNEKTVKFSILGVYAVYVIFVCLNPWTGAIYTLSSDGEYMRGPFFAVMIVVYALYTIALIVLIIKRWSKIPQDYSGGLLICTPVIIAVAIAVQLMLPGWLMILPAYMICLVLAYLFLQAIRAKTDLEKMQELSIAAKTDQLTGLFNRAGMEVMVEQTREQKNGLGCMVIIADIDDLKSINDSLGHAEGDRAIKTVAEQLKSHFRASDTIVRYGGDEFLVFLTGKVTEQNMLPTLQTLVRDLSEIRVGKNNDFPVTGSLGAAFGVVGADAFDVLCTRADTALYHVKRNGKNGMAYYCPDMDAEAPTRKALNAKLKLRGR